MGTLASESLAAKMKLTIATDFSKAPGPRYANEGGNSGETFRKTVLFPKVHEAIKRNETLVVNLDGTYGFGTSFLEEAFGGLIRDDKIRLADLRRILSFKSDEEPDLIDEINAYMEEAEKESNP